MDLRLVEDALGFDGYRQYLRGCIIAAVTEGRDTEAAYLSEKWSEAEHEAAIMESTFSTESYTVEKRPEGCWRGLDGKWYDPHGNVWHGPE